jgi:signal peptidase I
MSEWSPLCATPESISPIFPDLTAELLRRGYQVRFRAVGASMQPTIEDGELITVAPVAATSIRRGDILLFQGKRGVIAHRVVRITGSARREDVRYLLRGDASVSSDDPVGPAQVLGRVLAVQRAGRRIDLTSRRARWLHAVRLCAAPVTRFIPIQS